MTRPSGSGAVEETIAAERAHYIPTVAFTQLCMGCGVINSAFGDDSFGSYLVGSSLARRDWRDVDVRAILRDEAYDRLFLGNFGGRDEMFALFCLAISSWLSQLSGLPVDFQFQRQTDANESFSMRNGHGRNYLGAPHVHGCEWPSGTKGAAALKDISPSAREGTER